jgi:hypothetical protein
MLKTSKKVLSVVLALVLVLSTLTVCSFAAFDSSTQKLGFILVPNKDLTKVQNGDEVTFTLYLDVADFSQYVTVGKLLFLYDSSAYSVDNSYTNLNDFAKFYKDGTASALPSSSTTNWNKLIAGTTQDISAFDKAYVWSGAADTTKDWDEDGTGNTAKQGYALTQEDGTRTPAELQFTFTVLDNTKTLDVMICNNFATKSTLQYFKTTDGTTQTNLDQGEVNTELASAMVNNPAAAGPAVTKAKSQVKMTPTSATTVADEFSFRVISTITDADWDAYFANTGVADATTSYITSVGMVAYRGTDGFDADTAKAVVAGTKTDDNYAAATTDYISKASDDADATFGAVVLLDHSTFTTDLTYMGFVQYVDASGNAQTIFYETAGTAALSSNYDNIVSAYLAAYPYAA